MKAERWMHPLIKNYFQLRGYMVRLNLEMFGDVVAYREDDDELVAVKARADGALRGLGGALTYTSFSDFVFIAAPSSMKDGLDVIEKIGLGLLLVNRFSGEVSEKLKPRRNIFIDKVVRSKVLKLFKVFEGKDRLMVKEALPISREAEEYLEVIYRLEERMGFAKTFELANRLKVVPGSVTNTVEGLERRGLIVHEPYRGVKLTDKGRRIALDVIRRHRLSERLLTDFLRLEWWEPHDAACGLEHAFTEEVMERLEKALGKPDACPHGNPIPRGYGEVLEEGCVPLINLKPREEGRVVKVTDERYEVLRYLNMLGLVPGAMVKVEEGPRSNGLIFVKVAGLSQPLGDDIASIIWVKKSRF